MSEPLVDVLTFGACPHAESVLELVRRVVAESGSDATVRRVDVPDAQGAAAHPFLGSPTIRVNGRDIEPGVADRDQYSLSCRIYRTTAGFTGEPDERWLREALSAAG